MGFDVAAESYDRFMGRYSVLLAPGFADFAGVDGMMRVLDVGSGPGALTAELVARLGAEAVKAVDPSPSFVDAARDRNPGVDVRESPAEQMPFCDDEFDASLAQLVVHFMSDPVGGLREMKRVTRPDGVVAACVWDLAGGQAPLSLFWAAARDVDPEVTGESQMAGTRQGHLSELFADAGLRDVEETALPVSLEHSSFEDWWEPYVLGVGPAGSYFARLDADRQDALRARCRELVPDPPFVLESRAWAARGRA
ncbi:MAG TPA: methyltransferase domain-containing protein [Gaiellaceae bacterium]|nr:methyltransferase domain-containing protein [Gaiellaceae bacterium]